MATETLVEALGKMYGFPERVDSSFTRGVAADADRLLPILARFASPEAKREVLRLLLDERCKVLSSTDWRALADSAMQVSYWTPYVTNIGERHFVGTLAPTEAR